MNRGDLLKAMGRGGGGGSHWVDGWHHLVYRVRKGGKGGGGGGWVGCCRPLLHWMNGGHLVFCAHQAGWEGGKGGGGGGCGEAGRGDAGVKSTRFPSSPTTTALPLLLLPLLLLLASLPPALVLARRTAGAAAYAAGGGEGGAWWWWWVGHQTASASASSSSSPSTPASFGFRGHGLGLAEPWATGALWIAARRAGGPGGLRACVCGGWVGGTGMRCDCDGIVSCHIGAGEGFRGEEGTRGPERERVGNRSVASGCAWVGGWGWGWVGAAYDFVVWSDWVMGWGRAAGEHVTRWNKKMKCKEEDTTRAPTHTANTYKAKCTATTP